jgi:hypothetical protein
MQIYSHIISASIPNTPFRKVRHFGYTEPRFHLYDISKA